MILFIILIWLLSLIGFFNFNRVMLWVIVVWLYFGCKMIFFMEIGVFVLFNLLWLKLFKDLLNNYKFLNI